MQMLFQGDLGKQKPEDVERLFWVPGMMPMTRLVGLRTIFTGWRRSGMKRLTR